MNNDALAMAVLGAVGTGGNTFTAHAIHRGAQRFGGPSLPEIAAKLRGRKFTPLPPKAVDQKHGSVRVQIDLDDGRVVVAALKPKGSNAVTAPNRNVKVIVSTILTDGEDEAWDHLRSRGRGVTHAELVEAERAKEADRAAEDHVRKTCPREVYEMLQF